MYNYPDENKIFLILLEITKNLIINYYPNYVNILFILLLDFILLKNLLKFMYRIIQAPLGRVAFIDKTMFETCLSYLGLCTIELKIGIQPTFS